MANNTALIKAAYDKFLTAGLEVPADFLPLPAIIETDKAFFNCMDKRWGELTDPIDIQSVNTDDIWTFKRLLRY